MFADHPKAGRSGRGAPETPEVPIHWNSGRSPGKAYGGWGKCSFLQGLKRDLKAKVPGLQAREGGERNTLGRWRTLATAVLYT